MRDYSILPAFALIEALYLYLSGATFFLRYFVPAAWAVVILLGLGLGDLWRSTRSGSTWRLLLATGMGGLAVSGFVLGAWAVEYYRDLQVFRNEQSLTRVGMWLQDNSATDARVLLEPLGHVGYYADRVMLDEVGLVTPQVVELKRRGVLRTEEYISILAPDYAVLHCDDSLRLRSGTTSSAGVLESYRLAVSYNPLGFDPLDPDPPTERSPVARSSCYEIWEARP